MFNIVGRSHFLPTKRPGYAGTSPIRSIARGLGAGAIRAWHWIESTGRSIASRGELQEMDDRMLKDLGISRAQAEFLANRRVWRVKSGTTDRI